MPDHHTPGHRPILDEHHDGISNLLGLEQDRRDQLFALSRREANLSLRVDRFHAVEPVEGFERRLYVPFSEWVRPFESGEGEMVRVRAYASERGTKSFELESLFGKIGMGSDGRGVIDAKVPSSEIDFYASRLLSVGTDVKVESPPELVELVRRKAEQIAKLHGQDSSPKDRVLTRD